MQNECFKQKVVVFLTFVTLYLILNPKPDKDNKCITIHFREGDTPLRTACRPFFALRTAYRHGLFWQFHLHKEDKMTVCCVHMFYYSCKR